MTTTEHRPKSWCWDHPAEEAQPATAPEAAPEKAPPELITVIYDTLRDFHDAYRAVQVAVRAWRSQYHPPPLRA